MRVTKLQAAQAAQRLATTEDGQIFLAWMTAKFGYTRRTTADGNIKFNEGQRSVMVDVGTLIDADLDTLRELEEQEQRRRGAMTAPLSDFERETT